jgi:hypothetical protein
LREFVALLSSNAIDFLVVGGHAVSFHGYPRYTGDIDLFVRATPENARRLLSALDAFGFGSLGLTVDDFTTPGRVVQLGRPPNRIDLLTSISGVEFEEAWATRVAATLDGIPVFFPSRDILLRNKDASGRSKDASDAAILRRRPTQES